MNFMDFNYMAKMRYFEKQWDLASTKIQVINCRCVVRFIDMEGPDEEMAE